MKGGAIGALTSGIVGGQVANGIPIELPFPPGLVPPEDQGQELTQLPSSYTDMPLVATATANVLSVTATIGGVPISVTQYAALTIALLRQLMATVQVVNLIAPYLEIDNMVIEKIHVHRDADTGRAAEIEVGLKQIRFVSTTEVPAPAPEVIRATPPVNKGEQGASDASDAQKKSALLALTGILGITK